MYPHHYNHEQRGVEPLRLLCKTLGTPNEWKKMGLTAVLEHMKGGIFNQMTIAKKVSFIEKIDKSTLGLKGLQMVVYSDRSRSFENDKNEIKDKQYDFYSIETKMLKTIDEKYIINKYNIKPCIEFRRKLHEERIKWLKNNI